MRFGIAAFAAMLTIASPLLAQEQLSIATAGTGGVYYPLGGGLAGVINQHVDGYAATAEVTGGSVENMGLIARGDADLAIALGDTVYQARNGTGRFEGQRLEMISGLASLYTNMVQIVTLADSGITTLSGLRGKRVSVGAPGSGTAVNAKAILAANGMSYDDIDEQRLNFNETADALANGDIEAGFWSVAAPTSAILNLATTQSIRMIELSDRFRVGQDQVDLFGQVSDSFAEGRIFAAPLLDIAAVAFRTQPQVGDLFEPAGERSNI